ncbi:MAG: MoxR family ATPase [Actinobacteria bacterium]|nr:MoxR family ATPase [Actinomycetota bacterium]
MTENPLASNLARKNGPDLDEFAELGEAFARLHANVCRVIVGKEDIIRTVLTALISRGHVLLEDIPGVGKTTLAKSIARSISATYARIQFTPDLLPSDITGSTIYSPKDERFYWSPGPIFANIVLADEINRTSPRTQSALLEAMEEQQVTVDRATHPLPQPFFVIATQNPHELHGTFPLPEGQKDRFLVSISIGLPNRASEQKLVRDQLVTHPLDELEPVIDAQEVTALQAAVRRVTVAENVLAYALDITTATRSHEAVSTGASPRASVSLMHACQGIAFTEGRAYVIPDDVQRAAVPVLAHRILLGHGTARRNTDTAGVIRDILSSCRVPV